MLPHLIVFFINIGKDCLPNSASDTADFLLFGDKLFDSVNGQTVEPHQGNLLRCAVRDSSQHVDFWYEAIKVLQTVKFFNDGKQEFVPPTIKNWIFTIRGFIYIWKKLNGAGFKFLSPRNLNQDPLENFFGCIRSHGSRNVNPNCSAFVDSFKSLLINNFVSVHSPGANCENDESDGALDTLRHFITQEIVARQSPVEELEKVIDIAFKFSSTDSHLIIKLHAYIAGYLAKAVLKEIGTCNVCRSNLLSTDTHQLHALIEARAFSSKALLKPNIHHF